MPKYSKSPFVEWRKKAGVSATELALALEISKTHLSDLERGTAPLSDGIKARIQAMGIDGDTFAKKHKAWMEERRKAVMSKLKVDI